ncbi:NAD-dependent epimerase/dehydratase family protein [Planktomarina temperata]|nr:NAD-dependent epimerase/dehydratase family protein [Planktomarina temperata]
MTHDENSMLSNRWLITGGCGFIGTHLIKYILEKRLGRVRVLDNLTTGTLGDLGSVCSFERINVAEVQNSKALVALVEGDIENYQVASRVCNEIDFVVHLAANTGVGPSIIDPRCDMTSNVLGTFNMLQASLSSGVKRFVFASSSAPIGNVAPPIHEELPARPLSPYGASKLCGEAYCSAFYHSFGLETVALRFGNVYGEGSKHKSSVVSKFIKEALDPNAKSWEIYGDGAQTRDFIYVNDLVGAIIAAANTTDIGGELFQIATSHETSVLQLAKDLNDVLSENGLGPMSIVNVQPKVGDAKRNYSDTSKAQKLLGWSAKTELSDGLRRTLRYFLESKGLK